MTEQVDVIVVGGGVIGMSAAWQLACRGLDVMLLEQSNSEHGQRLRGSRPFDVSRTDATHLSMLTEAHDLWRELEEHAGSRLLDDVGAVVRAPHPELAETAARLARFGFPTDILDADAAADLWPGIRFDDPVLHSPAGGVIDAAAAVSALQASAEAEGAIVFHRCRVVRLRILGDTSVRVEVAAHDEADRAADVVEAPLAVVAAGAWTERLLGRVLALPRLVVRHRQPLTFPITRLSRRWPAFVHAPSPADRRHRGQPGTMAGSPSDGRITIDRHGGGRRVDPDATNPRPDPRLRAELRRYVSEWLPGADMAEFTEDGYPEATVSDGNFVIDRIGPVIVGGGFTGLDFGFAPTAGRMLADLATAPAPTSIFSLREKRRAS